MKKRLGIALAAMGAFALALTLQDDPLDLTVKSVDGTATIHVISATQPPPKLEIDPDLIPQITQPSKPPLPPSDPLASLHGSHPQLRFLSWSGSELGRKVLVLMEERLRLAGLYYTVRRYLRDLGGEGWRPFLYSYDVRSHETGLPGHRHLPSEVLELRRVLRDAYFASNETLQGVVLIGDFPAAGTVTLEDRQVGSVLEQHEMDFFGVDVVLSDPLGRWESLPEAPSVPPGSPASVRPWYDAGRHPSGRLHERTEWSPPALVHSFNLQDEVAPSDRNPKRFGAIPRYWVGRITASQAGWVTGTDGLWHASEAEEIRLLAGYFDRNHAHRRPAVRRSPYAQVFLDSPDFGPFWKFELSRMAAAIPTNNIEVHADVLNLTIDPATIENYLGTFARDFLLCQYVMHSHPRGHAFFPLRAGSAPETFPPTFPATYTSPGGGSVTLPLSNEVQARHLISLADRLTITPRFYLLGGCDVGDLLHRPQDWLTQGTTIAPTTPLNRQHGAMNLGVAYLMHAAGLAVLAHNVTNPPADYGALYQALSRGASIGEAYLALLNDENDRKLQHYRNIFFGDPTLQLRY